MFIYVFLIGPTQTFVYNVNIGLELFLCLKKVQARQQTIGSRNIKLTFL